MTGVVAWLNLNSGALTLLFSCVVAVATVAYVVLTRSLVRETRLVREAQFQPHVAISVQQSQAAFGFIDLVVENHGPGAAYDVRFNVEPNLELAASPVRHLSDIGFLRNGIRYFAAHQMVSTYLIRLIGVTDDKLEGPDRLRFAIRATYRDVACREYSDSFEIDFAHFVGMRRLGSPPLSDIAKHLDKIQQAVGRLASGWSKVKVINYSPEDIERECEQFRLSQLSGQLIDESTTTEPELGTHDDA